MSIKVTCTGCDKLLNAPDHAAGKKIRCPACQTVVAVPAAAAAADEDDAAVTDAPKKKPSSSGVSKKRLDDEEGGSFDYKDEDEDEGERRPKKRRRDEDEDDDYGDMRGKRRAEPHRGTTILVLGILSIVTACFCPLICWILGGVATNMAGTDGPKMERGLMDPAGQGTTTAGRICGIIGIVLGLISFIAGVALKVAGN